MANIEYFEENSTSNRGKKALIAIACPLIPIFSLALIFANLVPFMIELAIGCGFLAIGLIHRAYGKKWRWFNLLLVIVGISILVISVIFPTWLFVLITPGLTVEAQYWDWDYYYWDYYYWDYYYWDYYYWGYYWEDWWWTSVLGIGIVFFVLIGWRKYWFVRMNSRIRVWRGLPPRILPPPRPFWPRRRPRFRRSPPPPPPPRRIPPPRPRG